MFSRARDVSVVLFIVLVSFLVFNISNLSYAFLFEPRSVVISTGVPAAIASHNFSLSPPTTNNIGSLAFEYCSNSPIDFDICTPPAGLDTSGTSLVSQSGNVGFSYDAADSTANRIVISRPSAPGIMALSTYNFNNIINPSTPGETVYVRLASYASLDGSGPLIDKGGVAFAVQSIFNVDAFVPPFLQLCVGLIVAPDCSTLSGDSIDLGILSSSHANTGQSQFATATNDPSGYVIFASGTTMTSGNNIITSVPNPVPSFPGTAQFGINLRANTIPAIGQDPVGLGTGVPSGNYNIPNRFTYNDGDIIASSPINSNYNRNTVSYLVNIINKQPPGIYTTTITYIATVQF